MNILAVTTKSPYPLYEGRALRTFNLLREAARVHRVVLATYVQSAEEQEGLEMMRSVCAEVHAIPLYLQHARLQLAGDVIRSLCSSAPLHAVKYDTAAMRRLVSRIIAEQHIDIVHLDMLHLGELLPSCAGRPVVLVEHNVEWVLLDRRRKTERDFLRRVYIAHQTRRLRDYERRICERAAEVATVSSLDAEQLRALAPAGRYTSVPNGVDTKFFTPAGGTVVQNSLVYVGGLTWLPNLDAMRFFCAEVLPLIRAEIPDVTLNIVGKLPGRSIVAEFSAYAGVRLSGLVEDVRPHVAGAAAFVVPLRVGGGTRLKILDALAMAKAVVATRLGAEGLAVTHGADILLADDPAGFAREVTALLRDPARACRLGAAGRRLVEGTYDWSVIYRTMEAVYQSATRDAGERKSTSHTCVES